MFEFVQGRIFFIFVASRLRFDLQPYNHATQKYKPTKKHNNNNEGLNYGSKSFLVPGTAKRAYRSYCTI